jgi:hypothetical protein
MINTTYHKAHQRHKIYVVHPSVGLRPPNASSYLLLFNSHTFIRSYALSHRAKLHRRWEICALSARSSFPKVGHCTNLTSLLSTEPYIHNMLHKETQNYLHLALQAIFPLTTSTIHSCLFILLHFLTKRPKNG